MKVYSIKVTLRGVSPMIWRRIRIAGRTTLVDLQAIIRVAQDYDEDPLHQFRIYAKDYEIYKNQCVDQFGKFYNATIDDFEFDVGDRFIYTSFTAIELSFIKNRLYDIRIESIEKESKRKKIPFCVSGNGMPGVKKYEYALKMMEVLKIIFDEKDTTTTVGEVRRDILALDTLRLNRNKVNKVLTEKNPQI